MKKYSVKLLALLMIVFLSVIGMAGAADTCAHSYTLHGGRICSKCFRVKAGAGCSIYYSLINGTKTHKVYCGTDGHGSELIRQENCIYTSGHYSVSDGKAQKVCNLCHDEQWHARSVREVSSNQAIFLDADTHLVDNLDCAECGVMYRVKAHQYEQLGDHRVPVCSDCNTDKDGKEHDKNATSWLECHGCNGCTNCDGLYLLHGNRICDKCHSVKAGEACYLHYEYDEQTQSHYIGCGNSNHGNTFERIAEEECTTANGYYRIKDGVPAAICDLCHNDGRHMGDQVVPGGFDTEVFHDGNHFVNTKKCNRTDCGEIYTVVPHTYDQPGHEVPCCDCGRDADGRVHNLDAATPEDCEACREIIAEQTPEEPVCKHSSLINRYFTWVDAKQHRESSVCKDCGEVLEITSSHSANASWHNGTVCLYCRTDENGVKHNWSNGECTVCPKPIPDGLNPDDGWVYENGEKSDFTGLAEYDGGLFYILNGQWQKELNGLKLIGDEFWYLAGGQVQEHHGFAEYDGEWFYLDGGKLDVTASGVYGYDGKTFLVAAGRLVAECTGLAQVPSGEWYYVAEGRVLTEFSGEVEYDGKTFQIVNGKLDA